MGAETQARTNRENACMWLSSPVLLNRCHGASRNSLLYPTQPNMNAVQLAFLAQRHIQAEKRIVAWGWIRKAEALE